MLNRVILSDNGTLTDITEETDTYSTSGTSHSFVAAEDAIYIGTRFPLSEKYFKASGGLGTLSVKYWDGDSFRAMVDKRDKTAGLSTSGYLKFTPNRDYGWQKADTADIAELSSVTIYDQFWLEITVDTDATIDLAWIGDLFCTDSDLESEYPDLLRPSMLTAFKAGKTDWEEQRVIASDMITDELINRGAIKSSNQLFEVERFRRTAVSKTAELAFAGFGENYMDDENKARKKYSERFNMINVLSDQDEDGLEDEVETTKTREIFLNV